MAFMTLAALAAALWAGGCTGLSGDCELNLNCPSTTPVEPPNCSGVFFSSACDACIRGACCQELSDCKADTSCLDYCVFAVLPVGPECNAPPTSERFSNMLTCMSTNCKAECVPRDQCNPVTGDGCPADGTNCELVVPGVFVCIPPYGAPAAQCEACSNTMGPYCGARLRCYTAPGKGTCARYCCNDADCGADGRCELDPMAAFGATLALPEDKVGLCVSTTATPGAACNAPEMSPSNGACFGGYPPL